MGDSTRATTGPLSRSSTMPTSNLDFSFDMSKVDDRRALLETAARRVDDLQGHLGPGLESVHTPEGDLLRDLKDDEAKLAGYPVVYRISDEDFLKKGLPKPVQVAKLLEEYNYYWVQFPVGLAPKHNWAFNRIEMKIEFAEAASPHLEAKAFQIFPDKKFQTLLSASAELSASTELEVGLTEHLEFASAFLPVSAGPVGFVGGAEANLVVKPAASFVAGPFHYRLVKAQIDHSATGLNWVRWQIDGAEFFQENSPELVVIAQVPKEVKELHVSAAVQASRYFAYASASLKQRIAQLSKEIIEFFHGGLPTLPDARNYDLTPKL